MDMHKLNTYLLEKYGGLYSFYIIERKNMEKLVF